MMEIPGVCALCGEHTLVRSCATCGRHVCRAHFVASVGMCTRCAALPGGRAPPAPKEPPNLPPPEDAGGRFT